VHAVLEQRPVFFNLLQLPEEQLMVPMELAVEAQAHLTEPAVMAVQVAVAVDLGLMVMGEAAEAVRVIRAELL
jgi:hypothetical protein